MSDNRRYLAYGDGTPFLWIGDTAWAVPMRASDEEWEAYLADRAAKHFTLIQVAPAPSWAGDDRPPGREAVHRQDLCDSGIRPTGKPSSARFSAPTSRASSCCWSG